MKRSLFHATQKLGLKLLGNEILHKKNQIDIRLINCVLAGAPPVSN